MRLRNFSTFFGNLILSISAAGIARGMNVTMTIAAMRIILSIFSFIPRVDEEYAQERTGQCGGDQCPAGIHEGG